AHAQLDAIAVVGRNASFPERLRHDAEHRTAVDLLSTGLDRVNAERSYREGIDEWGEGSRHAKHARVSLGSRVPVGEPRHRAPPAPPAATRYLTQQRLEVGPRYAAAGFGLTKHT